MPDIWCTCALSLQAVELWLKDTGQAILQQDVQCGLCHKPRLSLLMQDHPGYLIHVDDYVFEAHCALGTGNLHYWFAQAIQDREVAAQVLGQPFRCLRFEAHYPTQSVECAVMEIYSEFETALFLGRQRHQLSVFDLAARQPITIA